MNKTKKDVSLALVEEVSQGEVVEVEVGEPKAVQIQALVAE